MIKQLFLSAVILMFVACSTNTNQDIVLVTDTTELQTAIKSAKPGTNIIMQNGIWKDVMIVLEGNGSEQNPISLKAETPGKVFIEGVSSLEISGNYLNVEGLFFRKGYSPKKNVIAFRKSENQVANHCTVTNCVILDFNKPERDQDDLWVQFYGRHNTLSNSYLAGKTNGGPTLRVDLKGNQSINNYHQIINNHFGPRPRKGGARGETIQLGSSFTSMSPSYTTIANNLFEECNGEVEIISSKTNFNLIKNNVFYKSEGSVVTRHGNYCHIDGNYFIGDGTNKNFGGIRIVNTGHWITNNYFYNIIGENFRSPLAVMNGIPKSPLNRYNQVTDIVVAYNTYVNCKSPWQFGVGTNIAQKDVLPKSEIRSARPLRSIVANNVIYNENGDTTPIIEHDKADGVQFKDNLINNNGIKFKDVERIQASNFEIKKVGESIYLPILPTTTPYQGFGFETIQTDLFGNSRNSQNSIGATTNNESKIPSILDKSLYGANWYSNIKKSTKPNIISVNPVAGELTKKINEAKSGDVLLLNPGKYGISNSLKISKEVTLKATSENTVTISYSGAANSPLFELNPYGDLIIEKIALVGTGTQQAFSNLKENMSNHYGLTVIASQIQNFDYILKAYKQTFAEEILFKNSHFSDCSNGIELSEETNDRGDYNVEFLTIDNCKFKNIERNVVDYYRGGYDESTIGGNLLISKSTFTNCGAKEKNNILLNTRGIVNVKIENSHFKNNKIDLIALLWGAKNNSESNNKIQNSGKFHTEENLAQKLMY
ncbi:chondroitinase-B domain-containing protein [Flavicella sp.]|uniref:chondroitinase-B domain-containing protein n=1 Tax=Flavicella sp. TaxID=2957742 RepID=UPI00261F6D36|nr:chondroitinase-B domain-containing protein [Flavicella sp.]MDG1805766.1 chondroitinase-B domain-containing protein [Flavicella sp.]MDG2279490.1 chondroitinase-B domain-containing protein [Flavicella sp.]